MARRERALDPAAGPLQSFAFQLRQIRAQAGNPTYRALARAAGYSATTLSEAARGDRKPTLDVVLAYVGACRGDLDEWRQRWHALDAALDPATAPPAEATPDSAPAHSVEEASRSAPAPSVEAALDLATAAPVGNHPAPGAGAGPSTGREATFGAETATPFWPGDPAPARTVRPKALRNRLIALAAAAVLVVAGAMAAVWWPHHQAVPTATEPACPRLPAKRAFTGETYGGGAPVRAGASADDPVVSTVASHCTLGFTGFCLGAKMRDATSDTPDIRWFILSDGTVVPSAVIHGNPPAKLRPARCRHDLPGPSAIALEVAASAKPGEILARASGSNVVIVGFAARPATGTAKWQQIGLSEGTDFRATWRPAQPGGAVTVVAAACLGGGSPTEVIDARALPGGRVDAAARANLSRAELAAASRSACQYPRT